MITIFGFRLNTGKEIYIVGDIANKDVAKDLASTLSPKMFADDKLHVKRTNDVIAIESLGDIKENNKGILKEYYVAFFMLDELQFLTLREYSVQGVYNLLKSRYGIDDDIVAMIFELKQSINNFDIEKEVKEYIEDHDKMKDLTYRARVKLQKIYGIDTYIDNINAMINMVEDKLTGRYKDIDENKVHDIIKALLYFVYTTKFGISDEMGSLLSISNRITKDILKYKNWSSVDIDDIILA